VRPKDAFIPPRPVRPEELKRGPAREAEPFHEADLMNAGDTPGKSKGRSSLFSRMTGLGLGSSKAAPAAKPSEPQFGAQKTAQAPAERPAAPPPQPAPPAAQQPAQQQSDLAPSKAEEEMLEIPAFLRRQAN
jgi:cell division protein FtsZ